MRAPSISTAGSTIAEHLPAPAEVAREKLAARTRGGHPGVVRRKLTARTNRARRPTLAAAVERVRTDPDARLAVVFAGAFAFAAGFALGAALAERAGPDETAQDDDRRHDTTVDAA